MSNLSLQKLLLKIKNCPNYETLYRLEEDFNKVGLTLQSTPKNRVILCMIRDGNAYASAVMEDYVFVGATSDLDEVPTKTIDCIMNFVIENAGSPARVVNNKRSWQHNPKPYGQVLVVNEDVEHLAQIVEDDLL